jgi:uncharacterized protein
MSEFTPLILSLAALALGPPLHYLSKRSGWALSLLDGFVLIGVTVMVVFDAAPRTFSSIGPWAILALLLGFVFPGIIEKRGLLAIQGTKKLDLLFALIALGLHTALDGVALGLEEQSALSVAIVLHRLPVAVFMWWLVSANYGNMKAIMTLGFVGLTTVLGHAFAGQLDILTSGYIAGFEAFVAGTLLHVLFGHALPGTDTREQRSMRLTNCIGALLGLFMALHFQELGHHHGTSNPSQAAYGHRFIDLCLESAPALLLGYALAGIAATWLPQASMRWLKSGGHTTQALKGTVFGIPLPICSCGVVPLYQSLIKKGAPTSAAIAFLIATPELGIESILLSVPLLGGKLTGLRLASAAIAATLIGIFVGRITSNDVAKSESEKDNNVVGNSLHEKLKRAFQFGFVEVLDQTLAWIVLGIAIAASLDAGALAPLLTKLPTGFDVFLAALIGMPIYVCASGATPLAAGMLAAGLSPGAAVAFLLAGPATNITTFGVLSQLHGKRMAVMFGVAVTVVSTALGLLINVSLGTDFSVSADHMHAEHGHFLQWASLGILGLLCALSIYRQSPRGFIGGMFHPDHGHDHDHDHGHHHH